MTIIDHRHALPDRLETDRLVLRAPEHADIEAITALAQSEAIHSMTTLPHPYEREHARQFVEGHARSDAEFAYAIVTRDGTLVGVTGLHFRSDRPHEIGYWIGEPFWGNGYATEAAGALVNAAIEAGTQVLNAQARSENAASRAVLLKLGFASMGQAVADCGPHKGVSITSYRLEGSAR